MKSNVVTWRLQALAFQEHLLGGVPSSVDSANPGAAEATPLDALSQSYYSVSAGNAAYQEWPPLG